MTDPFEHRPSSRAEIVAAFDQQARTGQEFLERLPPPDFFAAPPGKWSPCQTRPPVTRANSRFALGLVSPRLILRGLFGCSGGTSRDFVTMRSAYHAVLAEGAQASGRYLPPPEPPPPDPAAARQKVLERWRQSLASLRRRAEGWTEDQLDVYRLPHPLLGKLTLREMLFFTVYHNTHHLRILAERQGQAA
ncbi:MAG TPA: DinB family protein [Gemmatales bacterium]|nr:DinB family protein [Gemmatales bacterium]